MPDQSTGPKDVRVVKRALTLLEFVGEQKVVTLKSAIAHTGYPKTTTYRILETLCRLGYLSKGHGRGEYCVSAGIMRIGSYFRHDEWLFSFARPLMVELGKELVYPVALATVFGTSMVLQETTDHMSPVARTKYGQGVLIPLLRSASGKVYLAFCARQARNELIGLLSTSELPEHRLARNSAILDRVIRTVRQQGYARTTRSVMTDDFVQSTTVAVPVFVGTDLVAALSMRHLEEGVRPQEVVARYLPSLQQYAAKIGELIESMQSGDYQ